jgi:anaerobic selenocysteine-containing dehydrogenase
MAMLNVILNELLTYDAEYLKEHTNAIYLMGDDGNYVRDAESNRRSLWDQAEGRAKVYDSPTLQDPALEGSFQVGEQECRPSTGQT